ncbi:MAG: MBG domain-containing protein, partial [Lachnospiraceae bacterium]|nr:MBG domain-containing protein [Lachnospiraceae bacterium]
MKHLKKRIFAVSMAVALIVGSFGNTYSFAKVNEEKLGAGKDADVLCTGTDDFEEVSDHVHDGIDFNLKWKANNCLPSYNGNYYLTEDVTITGTWYVYGYINLCLNGHSITFIGYEEYTDDPVINVCSGFELNIYDYPGTGKIMHGDGTTGVGVLVDYGGKFTLNDGTICNNTKGVYLDNPGEYDNLPTGDLPESFVMNGGTIEDNSDTVNAGGVYVGKYQSFVMNDGKIQNNITKTDSLGTPARGAGVYVDENSSFILNNGEITGNNGNEGGGVYLNTSAIMTMKDGLISKNSAFGTDSWCGGGVYIHSATFNMNGGTISENTTQRSGGGIFMCFENSVLNLKGGTISGNQANISGGGVGMNGTNGTNTASNETINLSGGTITDNISPMGGGLYFYDKGDINVSGSPVITGNYSTSDKTDSNNLYILSSELNKDLKLSVVGAFEETAKIGVTYIYKKYSHFTDFEYLEDVFTNGYGKNNEGKSPKDVFVSDNENYIVGWDSKAEMNEAKMKLVHEHEFTSYEAKDDTITATCADTDEECTLEDCKASITINKPEVTTYGDEGSAEATVTGDTDELNGYVVTYETKEGEALDKAPTDAGVYVAYMTLTVGETEYKASVEYTIAKKEVTVSWTEKELELEYNGKIQTPTATLDGADVEVNITGEGKDVGTYTAKVEINNDNYELKNDSTEYTITAKELTPVVAEVLYVYDGTVKKPEVKLDGVAEGDTVVANVTGEAKDAGTHTATVQISDTNYKLASESVEYVIAPKEIGLEWTDTELTYNGEAQKPTATATGLIEGDTCNVTVTGEQTEAGTYTATATELDNPNYVLPSENTTSFTIKADESKEDGEESKDDQSKEDESKQDESQDDQSKEDESKQDESQDDQSKEDESKEDDSKQDESQDDQGKEDDSKQDESKDDQGEEDDSKQDESKDDQSKEDESKDDQSKDDQSKDDSGTDKKDSETDNKDAKEQSNITVKVAGFTGT